MAIRGIRFQGAFGWIAGAAIMALSAYALSADTKTDFALVTPQWVAAHCATMSRAQPSHCPHWVATPSSNWMSSKLIPPRTWRAISRSETRRQTQTIMAGRLAGWKLQSV